MNNNSKKISKKEIDKRVEELMSIAGFASGQFGKDKKAVQKIKAKKLERIMSFAGMASGLFVNETVQSIKSKME